MTEKLIYGSPEYVAEVKKHSLFSKRLRLVNVLNSMKYLLEHDDLDLGVQHELITTAENELRVSKSYVGDLQKWRAYELVEQDKSDAKRNYAG